MTTACEDILVRERLIDRRERLAMAVEGGRVPGEIHRLLTEVDAALGRLETGCYGLCEVCGETVEADRLEADPLLRVCLSHLSTEEQRALEHDLETAGRIQRGLLPPARLTVGGWQADCRIRSLGPVGGDWCDLLVTGKEGELWFLLGDVAGKGVAASLLGAHLLALYRSLVPLGLPLEELVRRINRLLAESTPASSYATAVCGVARADGEIELAVAGHPPPLRIEGDRVTALPSLGLPLGLFSDSLFRSHRLRLDPGEAIVLYSDGVTEATDGGGEEYGLARLQKLAEGAVGGDAEAFLGAVLGDLERFLAGTSPSDDLTLMVLSRRAEMPAAAVGA